MQLIRNSGNDRVIDRMRPILASGHCFDAVTGELSLFAFAELLPQLSNVRRSRLLLPQADADLSLLGSDADRPARNQLHTRWLAGRLGQWLADRADVRRASGSVPQGAFVVRDASDEALEALIGSLSFSTAGLGLTPGNPLSLIQAAETPEEARLISQWLDTQWSGLAADPEAKSTLVASLQAIASHRDPLLIYTLILHHLFHAGGVQLDEDQIVKSATGIRDTVVWRKRFKFQRDGVVVAIDKLNRFGGCIIADSVALGKTF